MSKNAAAAALPSSAVAARRGVVPRRLVGVAVPPVGRAALRVDDALPGVRAAGVEGAGLGRARELEGPGEVVVVVLADEGDRRDGLLARERGRARELVVLARVGELRVDHGVTMTLRV